MSALDQALTKAYAKDRPVAAPPIVPSPGETRTASAPCAGGPAIDQLYRDGAYYRIEAHTATAAVPAPHVPALPPTSPRRTVRRSLLRFFASSQPAIAAQAPAASQPRVARKVIIRHISRGPTASPLGIVPSSPPLTYALAPDRGDQDLYRAELPPETIDDQPATLPTAPLPAAPQVGRPRPHEAPLNLAPLDVNVQSSPPIDLYSPWISEAAAAPVVVVAESAPSEYTSLAALVAVELEALDAAEDAAVADLPTEQQPEIGGETASGGAEVAAERVHQQPKVEICIDSPHSQFEHRPHLVFHPPRNSPSEIQPVEQQPAEQPQLEHAQPIDAELTFAETSDQPLASDLIPLEPEAPRAPAVEATSDAAVVAKPAVPLWEVDRFHWPRTCEKLLTDEHGYLLQAGERLLAAVRDGLKVLAITGSRRGEGRTTLALCLARAAVKAGVQTAVMDADFARPQLATKIALDVAYGWQDAALGRIPLSEAAIKSLADNLTVLPLESSAATRSLSLADPRVTATIRAAAATFELLILDIGPLAASDKIAFPPGEACPLDAAIVVQDQRFALKADSDAIGQALLAAGLEAVGIAENFVTDEELA